MSQLTILMEIKATDTIQRLKLLLLLEPLNVHQQP